MNFKRATIWGLVLYLIMFIIATILWIVFPDMWLIWSLFIVPIVYFLLSKFFYFRKEEPEKLIKEAFFVGLYWMIILIVGDIIFLVYAFGFGWEFFLHWGMPIIWIEIIAFTIIGAITEKK